MVVAYQDGLQKAADELNKLGFTVIPWQSARYADALIYHFEQGGESILNSSYQAVSTPSQGMLMVNVKGLTISQVAEILNDRCYSPLFS